MPPAAIRPEWPSSRFAPVAMASNLLPNQFAFAPTLPPSTPDPPPPSCLVTGQSGEVGFLNGGKGVHREERVTVQGPVKEQQPDGMSHRGSIEPPKNCGGVVKRAQLIGQD